MIEHIVENWAQYSVVILAVLGAASAIARITPNTADNRVMNAIWKVVNRLGLRGGPTD